MNINNENRKSKSSSIANQLLSSTSSAMKNNNVYVEKPEILEDLLNDIDNRPSRKYNSNFSSSSPPLSKNINRDITSPSLTASEIQKQLLFEQIKNDKKLQENMTKNNIQKALLKKQEKQETRFRYYNNIIYYCEFIL